VALFSLAFFAVSLFRLASVLPEKKTMLMAPVFFVYFTCPGMNRSKQHTHEGVAKKTKRKRTILTAEKRGHDVPSLWIFPGLSVGDLASSFLAPALHTHTRQLVNKENKGIIRTSYRHKTTLLPLGRAMGPSRAIILRAEGQRHSPWGLRSTSRLEQSREQHGPAAGSHTAHAATARRDEKQ
jgi:hypothetical protein